MLILDNFVQLCHSNHIYKQHPSFRQRLHISNILHIRPDSQSSTATFMSRAVFFTIFARDRSVEIPFQTRRYFSHFNLNRLIEIMFLRVSMTTRNSEYFNKVKLLSIQYLLYLDKRY